MKNSRIEEGIRTWHREHGPKSCMNQSILTNSRELILIIEFFLYEEAFALLTPQELLHARFSSGWTCCAELL